jgi:heterodisulfide reductase subunit C2
MSVYVTRQKTSAAFTAKIEELSKQDLLACYQCGKCSAGCPMANFMDILPNQIIRYAQIGLEYELRSSNAIWLCVSCYTCNTRCPKGVRIAEVIEAVRRVQLRERKDHLDLREVDAETLKEVPPIALIGSLRKFTS